MDLACSYHDEVVGPLLAARWPGLPYAAARLGSGSDVLGLDDAMSRDHDWGLRLTVLLDRTAAAAVGGIGAVDSHLERVLPPSFRSLPTRFATTWDPTVRQRAEVATPEEFAASRLGIGVDRPWNAEDWLAVTGQSVLEITGGPVFRDTPGTITDIRRRLTWYPDDVWRYVVAADWARIGQELPFLGRTGSRGDDLGSRVLTGRFVAIAMHLGFLLERRWPPYPKWRDPVRPVAVRRRRRSRTGGVARGPDVAPARARARRRPCGPTRGPAGDRAADRRLSAGSIPRPAVPGCRRRAGAVAGLDH